jgi:hypothetical protein
VGSMPWLTEAPDYAAHHYERLHTLAEQFRQRRTVEAQFVARVCSLVDSLVAELRAEYAGRVAGMEAAHEAALTRLQDKVDQVTAERDAATARHQAVVEGRRLQATTSVDEYNGNTNVLIRRADNSGDNVWTLAELEEIAHRLRQGGGTDDTLIITRRDSMGAVIEAPEMVVGKAPPPDRPAPIATEPPRRPWWRAKTRSPA